ncbi:MAG: hypothetical protein M1817_002591 [Caeruleum heppii]|nr:MAG: hypothetical protein M1817_002591 [Caeruleum heppii]
MSKLDRRNQARQKQQSKHKEKRDAISIFAGAHGAPRIVAVIPLSGDVDASAAVQTLNGSLEAVQNPELSSPGVSPISVDRFKQKLQYVIPQRRLVQVSDACRLADFVVFILSANQEVDTLGERMLRTVEKQGISSVFALVQGLFTLQKPRQRAQIQGSLKSYIGHFFPELEKLYCLDARQECLNVIRSLCTATPKGIRWRDDRSWMLVESIRPSPRQSAAPQGSSSSAENDEEVVLSGVVRGRGLKSDRLIQVGDFGDFQISKITAAPQTKQLPTIQPDEKSLEVNQSQPLLEEPSMDADDVDELAPEVATMEDADDASISVSVPQSKGVLLDDHHYFSDDETHIPEPPKRLPRGTSAYQAAWFLDEVSDNDSDSDIEPMDQDGDAVMKPPALPMDGIEGLDDRVPRESTETAPSEMSQSQMFLDPSPEEEAEQLEAFRKRQGNEAKEDLEFPDEVELYPGVLARERLARYRGLKSLRTSTWETHEDKAHEPVEWNRLLQVNDYKGQKNRVCREAIVGGVAPGTRVNIHIRVPAAKVQAIQNAPQPLAAFSLLRHEHKQTVVNVSISLDAEHPTPIKSKTEMILQCGHRRLTIHPLFSQAGQTPNNVHKFDRYLHPGRTAIATFIGPMIWGPVPALFFLPSSSSSTPAPTDPDAMTPESPSPSLHLIATGTNLPSDHSRVIAKRVVLTGHPYKIHKKLVTVRYMFFNSEDVRWFKALQLWTKRGRSGFIKESLGTHGYFKATFDGRVNPQDAVGVSLYKRVFPRGATMWAGEGVQ